MTWPPVDGASDDKLMDLYSSRYKGVIHASMKSVLGEITLESPAGPRGSRGAPQERGTSVQGYSAHRKGLPLKTLR